MFCGNCGTKIEEGAKFCQSCGDKTEGLKKPTEEKNKSLIEKPAILDGALFYSEEWARARYFAVASVPHFDILVTKDNFYLIKFPKTYGGVIGLVLGLLLFNLLGALIGAVIGNSSDKGKRKKFRAIWVDEDHKIISREYENNLLLKIPKNKLKNLLSFQKNKFVVIVNGEETITLKKNKTEYEKFNKFIESYVL